MRRVPLLAMLLVLCALTVPGRADTGEGIVLHGSRTAYVDLYVYVNATITAADIRMSTSGSYVGFFLSPAPANRDTVGALLMPRVGATGDTQNDVMQLGQSWDVQAGKYRAFLITDGTADVYVPITGQGYRAYVPHGRAPLSLRPANFDIPAGSTGAASRMPVSLRARSLVVTAGLASSASLTAVERLTACVTATTDCAPSYTVSVRVPAGRTWSYGAALLPAGSYGAVLDLERVVGAEADSHVDGAVLVLTLGVQT
jgi:hypothetical protein